MNFTVCCSCDEWTIFLFDKIDHEQFQYTPSTIPATQNYNPNPNAFQPELYYEDGKDLHYSSHTGSHSTDFSYGSSNSGPNQSQSRYIETLHKTPKHGDPFDFLE